MATKERLSRLSCVKRLQELESQGGGGPLGFAKACFRWCGICAVTCPCCVLIVALSGLGLAKIVIGAIYLHSCEVAPMVPIFLIVGALMPILHNCTCQAQKDESGNTNMSCEGVRFFLCLAVFLFELAWLIAMSVFVLRARAEVAALPAWCSDPSLLNVSSTTLPPSTTILPPSTATLPTSTTTLPLQTTTTAAPPGVSNATSTLLPPVTTSPILPATNSLPVTSLTTGFTGVPTVGPSTSQCKTCHTVLLTFAFVTVVIELVTMGVLNVVGLCMWCMYCTAVCTRN